MRVVEKSVYQGPHRFGSTPMIRLLVELGLLQDLPTNRLPGFTDRLLAAVPTLVNHGCSGRRPGGFEKRLRQGTWMGHVVEHVALELQHLAGHPVTRGKTRSVPGSLGTYNVMFAYDDRAVGLAAGRLALELVAGLLPSGLSQFAGLDIVAPRPALDPDDGSTPGLTALRRMVEAGRAGPTTQSIIDAARARRIPVERLDDLALVRLGTGSAQTVMRASITGRTPLIAAELAGNKAQAKRVLAGAALPVPRGEVVTTADEAVAAAGRLLAPVVVKPLDGNHGRGVTLHLTDPAEIRAAFQSAAVHSRKVLVEEQLTGRDYRVLVVGGRTVAVAERVPAHVVGAGVSTVAQLVDLLNSDPRRGIGHGSALSRVIVDDIVRSVLARQGLELDSVPAAATIAWLRDAANLSAGGEAVDRTDEIHPHNAMVAAQAAVQLGLDVAGIDIITPDISRRLDEVGGGIVEVNAAPGFRMHVDPSHGQPRAVGASVVNMLYPRGTRAQVPTIGVTGSNGKSTVVRMLAHIVSGTDETVGVADTSGIRVGDRTIRKGDCSGPMSAKTDLADPATDVAILEIARGGIIRAGLGVPALDVGVLLNVTGDHLGLGGVETLDDLARVKSVVVRNVRRRGTSVLNADDPLTARMASVAGGSLALFSGGPLAEASPKLRDHVARGGLAATIEESATEGGLLVIHDQGHLVPIIRAADVPATLGGRADFNCVNALAAALAAYAHGVSKEVIAARLETFESSFELNPGRLNVTTAPGFTVIVDYGHNPPALRALGGLIGRMRADHDRVIGVVSTPGDRRDEDIFELGQVAATVFDEVVFRELPDGRGREAGGVVSLLTDGAVASGMALSAIGRVMDEIQAMDAALRQARPGDLVVLMPSDVDAVWQHVTGFRPAETLAEAQ